MKGQEVSALNFLLSLSKIYIDHKFNVTLHRNLFDLFKLEAVTQETDMRKGVDAQALFAIEYTLSKMSVNHLFYKKIFE
jgi:hypothetical protein